MSRANLIENLTFDEGLRLKLYKCSAGKLSIGVGRNIEDLGITRAEAIFLLNNDIDRCTEECEKNIQFFMDLSIPRREVLVMMCFNLGITRLLNFKKMLEYLKNKNFDLASSEMLQSEWASQVGNRAKRFSEVIKTGYYPTKKEG